MLRLDYYGPSNDLKCHYTVKLNNVTIVLKVFDCPTYIKLQEKVVILTFTLNNKYVLS